MTERSPVTATPRANMFADDVTPGSFKIKEDGTYILCECPCGCGMLMNLPIYSDQKTVNPSWHWDGDREKPTLSPSIRDLAGCKFHGFLQQGVWTFCPDSGQ